MTLKQKQHTICIIGMGYVGLPLAIEFAKHHTVYGIDTCKEKINRLQNNTDITNEISSEILQKSTLTFRTNPNIISQTTIIIVTVPTPIDTNNRPNLTALTTASETIGAHLSKNSIVVYESTVYPGVTEEICLPILEKKSGFTANTDFFLGYSPERLSPGETKYTLPKVVKVVSGSTPETAALTISPHPKSNSRLKINLQIRLY
jgi:UDP-N-acetyl-D-galactosamine dehydrogenase